MLPLGQKLLLFNETCLSDSTSKGHFYKNPTFRHLIIVNSPFRAGATKLEVTKTTRNDNRASSNLRRRGAFSTAEPAPPTVARAPISGRAGI